MYKITLPMSYDGVRYGVLFFRGVGYTDDGRIAGIVKNKGFCVDEVDAVEPIHTIGGTEMALSFYNQQKARLANQAAAVYPPTPLDAPDVTEPIAEPEPVEAVEPSGNEPEPVEDKDKIQGKRGRSKKE